MPPLPWPGGLASPSGSGDTGGSSREDCGSEFDAPASAALLQPPLLAKTDTRPLQVEVVTKRGSALMSSTNDRIGAYGEQQKCRKLSKR